MSGGRIVVWGAGAMGGSIGAELARQGREILFVDIDRDHVQAMNREGLRITGPVADFSVPVEAAHPNEVGEELSTILLCVKAHHTREACRQLAPHLSEEALVISIQNGLCELEISESLGAGRTMGAFVNFGADYLEPGVIHRGNRGGVVVGELDGSDTDRARRIHALLRAFEPRALLTDNIFGYLWGKLAYAALLFSTALTEASIADVLAAEEHRPILVALAREVVGVAVARRVRLEGFDGFHPEAFLPDAPWSSAVASLEDLVRFNRASAKTHSGIWRDLAVRGRPTEVDAQLGWVVRFGRELGLETPLNERVIAQIHEIEAGVREQRWDNLEELAAQAQK